MNLLASAVKSPVYFRGALIPACGRVDSVAWLRARASLRRRGFDLPVVLTAEDQSAGVTVYGNDRSCGNVYAKGVCPHFIRVSGNVLMFVELAQFIEHHVPTVRGVLNPYLSVRHCFKTRISRSPDPTVNGLNMDRSLKNVNTKLVNVPLARPHFHQKHQTGRQRSVPRFVRNHLARISRPRASDCGSETAALQKIWSTGILGNLLGERAGHQQ